MAKAKYKESDDKPKRAEPVKRNGAYVMMLFITFVAIVTGCVLLYLDNEEYGAKQPPPPTAVTIQKLGDLNKTAAAPDAAPVTPPGGMPPGGMPPAMP